MKKRLGPKIGNLSYPSFKTIVLGTLKNSLNETVLVSTPNI